MKCLLNVAYYQLTNAIDSLPALKVFIINLFFSVSEQLREICVIVPLSRLHPDSLNKCCEGTVIFSV